MKIKIRKEYKDKTIETWQAVKKGTVKGVNKAVDIILEMERIWIHTGMMH